MALSSLNITSLLNSLHTHLQSQTQLLPTLHAQLGLPPTALADELKALQEQLTQCVEAQIESRRKQVEEWTEKCAVIEQECIRYGNALGSNVKATGASVGELRKEHVLPKRHQLLGEYQEKLRQLYHTKLEQLSALTNRIVALSRTLGPEFFAPEILEPAPANGVDPHDPSHHRDVTPERFSRLEKELVRGKSEVSKRLSQLHGMMVQIDWLYTELGIVPPSLDELPPIPSSSSASSSHLGSSLAVPHFPRSSSLRSTSPDPFLSSSISTPTPASRADRLAPLMLSSASSSDDPLPIPSDLTYQRIFAQFVARLEEAEAETPKAVLEGVEPTPGLLAWASATLAELEDVKRRREAHIQAMYDQLEALWRRLGVADAEMDGFVEAHRGSTQEVVSAYEEELERMLELKRERMGVFVMNAREEIERLWEELMVGDEEKADFAPFFDDEHTEELLILHEDEIKRLKEEKRAKAPLLASIKKYFDICEEEKELAAAASDQSRLLGRGPRDPGRLLREEKMRKRVTKEKPRLEQDLLSSIPTWEEQTGQPFLVHGQPILRILMEAVGASSTEKENKRRANSRAGSVPPRAKTPSTAGPSHSRGTVTPAVRPGSSLGQSQSSKRARLGDSTSAHTNQYAPAGLPKPGTQHYALGHGRLPSAASQPGTTRGAVKGARAKRESFKPRPSVDCDAGMVGSRWSHQSTVGGLRLKVEEE
ncbi:hypothetical protein GLOTRDRAFT_81327 [Gloeophyllum trabeum ATCC 11539]|uniref:Microtubule associated protein n=1 Tax=Gloeophyllum trabeum (strain ATCC 11539 / FP-39264 / Madison 617) TaxID=670483 RepID=S7PUU4_GLOTA|nr:uncharacterized protein GLOTRDRAFT_81327 [Gloeophyllum trabeum ATCC 11539]EPQ51188.1 hypothetical protein GLOTRDRAFT_81327 [Gloeophyllum trabeum ATCC 11539]